MWAPTHVLNTMPPPPHTLQVELNTIASSFGCLSSRVSQLHAHLAQRHPHLLVRGTPTYWYMQCMPASAWLHASIDVDAARGRGGGGEGEGGAWEHNDVNKKSSWPLPPYTPCSLMVTCTGHTCPVL